jgi:hypothetical protein
VDAAEWTVGALEDIGEWTYDAVIDIGEWTIEAAGDVWDWVSEGENWLALGKTFLETNAAIWSLDFKKAFGTMFNEYSYSADGREKIAAREEHEREFPKRCIERMAVIEAGLVKAETNIEASF